MTTKTTSRNGTTQPTLEALAQEIKNLHEKSLDGVRSSLKYARETGLRLLKAKEAVKAEPGNNSWEKWVHQHCALDPRVAQNYMQIAKHGEELLQEPNGKRCTTITAALKRIRQIRRKGKGRRPTPSPAAALFRLSAHEARQKWKEAERFAKPDALDRTANEQIEQFITDRVRVLLNAVQMLAAGKASAGTEGEAIDPTTYAVVILRRLADKLNSPTLIQTAPEGTAERTEKIPA